MEENKNKQNTSETTDKTIIIDDSDTKTLRGLAEGTSAETAEKTEPKKKKKRRSLEDINKNAKWYPLKVTWFVISKVLAYALNVLLTVILIGAVTGVVVAGAFVIYIRNFVDLEYDGLDNLQFDLAETTRIYYTDLNGKRIELEDDQLHGSENRLWVDYKDIPDTLIDAYIAIEDQRFNEHNGVDAKRTLSAVFNFFIPTSSSYGGGSTITQQLIKNVSGENEATIQRKVQEIFRALDVEKKYSKEEILEMYLNTIYLSQNTNGVRTAADTYFNKELEDLTLVECAAIAAIGKSPVFYDPIINPQNNLERRNLVLREMLKQEKITEEEFQQAYDAPLLLNSGDGTDKTTAIHSYYIDAVIEQVIDDLMEEYGFDRTTASNIVYSGGLEIDICMNPEIQAIMEEVFENDEYWPVASGVKAQGAMVIMDPDTGNVLGLVGGRGEKKVAHGLNRATMSRRQPGSSIKPLSVYTLAIEEGLYSYGSAIDDIPQKLVNGRYWPSNADMAYEGLITLKRAVMVSKNTTAVSTLLALGIDDVYDHLTNDLGFTTIVESDKAEAPLALGGFTYGVTVMEMTQAYSALANEGVWSEARLYTRVIYKNGDMLLDNRENHKSVYSEDTAYIAGRLLKSSVHEAGGTAYYAISLKNKVPGLEICAKTGTTNNMRDYYFAGYTPDFLACSWYGYDNNKTITTNTHNPAAMLWDSIYEKIYAYLDENEINYQLEFDRPSSVIEAEYCNLSGQLMTEACEKDIGHVVDGRNSCRTTGYFTLDSVPTTDCPVHVEVKWDTETKAVCMPGCECDDFITVGLRYTPNRKFEHQVIIWDAQYSYLHVPEDYEYPADKSLPFYDNLLLNYFDEDGNPTRIYTGSSGAEKPYNRICIEHYFDFGINDDEDDESNVSDEDVSDEETSEEENDRPWWEW